MSDRPTKISFGEMRDSGVRGILVYRADCHDCDQRDRSPRASEYACKRSRGFRSGARTCQPVWILSYCGFDPLMGHCSSFTLLTIDGMTAACPPLLARRKSPSPK